MEGSWWKNALIFYLLVLFFSFFFLTQIQPSLFFLPLIVTVRLLCAWSSGTNMGNKLLSELSLHMYKHPQCELCVHPHSTRTHTHMDTHVAADANRHACINACVHIQHCPCISTSIYSPLCTWGTAYIVESTYKWFKLNCSNAEWFPIHRNMKEPNKTCTRLHMKTHFKLPLQRASWAPWKSCFCLPPVVLYVTLLQWGEHELRGVSLRYSITLLWIFFLGWLSPTGQLWWMVNTFKSIFLKYP